MCVSNEVDKIKLTLLLRAAEQDCSSIFAEYRLRRVFPVWLHMSAAAQDLWPTLFKAIITAAFQEGCELSAIDIDSSQSGLITIFISSQIRVTKAELEIITHAIADMVFDVLQRLLPASNAGNPIYALIGTSDIVYQDSLLDNSCELDRWCLILRKIPHSERSKLAENLFVRAPHNAQLAGWLKSWIDRHPKPPIDDPPPGHPVAAGPDIVVAMAFSSK